MSRHSLVVALFPESRPILLTVLLRRTISRRDTNLRGAQEFVEFQNTLSWSGDCSSSDNLSCEPYGFSCHHCLYHYINLSVMAGGPGPDS